MLYKHKVLCVKNECVLVHFLLNHGEQNLKICHSNLAAAEGKSRLRYFGLFTLISSTTNSPLGFRHLYTHFLNFLEISMMPYHLERLWFSTNHRNCHLGTLLSYSWSLAEAVCEDWIWHLGLVLCNVSYSHRNSTDEWASGQGFMGKILLGELHSRLWCSLKSTWEM